MRKRYFITLSSIAKVVEEIASDVGLTVIVQVGCIVYIAVYRDNFVIQNRNVDIVACKANKGIFMNRNNAGRQDDILSNPIKCIIFNVS